MYDFARLAYILQKTSFHVAVSSQLVLKFKYALAPQLFGFLCVGGCAVSGVQAGSVMRIPAVMAKGIDGLKYMVDDYAGRYCLMIRIFVSMETHVATDWLHNKGVNLMAGCISFKLTYPSKGSDALGSWGIPLMYLI